MASLKTLEMLRNSQPYRALEWKYPHRAFVAPPRSDHTAVRVTGGIGDLIIGLGVCEALNRYLGDVRVYSPFPEVGTIFSDLPQVHQDESLTSKGLDWFISLNAPAFFRFAENFRGFKNHKVNELFIANMDFITSGEWDFMVDNHPHLDNILARAAVKRGLNRESITYKFLGLDYIHPLPIQRRVISLEYITVHDGFDSQNKHVETRATKTWSLESWNDLILLLKIKFPGKKIIQLGGPKSRKITGVDKDLVGQLNFKDAMSILSRSDCHIDGDSGLVHAAHMLGVRSAVLFGPTNAEYFGYADNINLKPHYCGDCWWVQPDWLAKCPIGHEAPLCIDSIEPAEVVDAVERILQ